MDELDAMRDANLIDLAHTLHVRPWETDLLTIGDLQRLVNSMERMRKAGSGRGT